MAAAATLDLSKIKSDGKIVSGKLFLVLAANSVRMCAVARYRSCSFRFKVPPTTFATSFHASELQTYRRKTKFNAKWPFRVIQGHVFWSRWKGDKGLSRPNILTLALFVKVPTM